jgi:hypothetical protein
MTMTPDRLITLIAAYGADPSAFPQTEQAPARALLAAEPDTFAAALAEARALDAALDGIAEPPVPAHLVSAIIAGAPQSSRAGAVSVWLRGLAGREAWIPASGLAAAAAGLIAGLVLAPQLTTYDPDTDIEEVLLLAFGGDVPTDPGDLFE